MVLCPATPYCKTGYTGNLVKTGAGTLELSAQNTYTGNTTVEAGTLRLRLPNLADTSTLTIGTIAGSPAVLDLPNSGTDVVAVLIIDGASRPAGVYNSSNSGGAITGNGSIEVAASPAYLAWAAANGLGGSGGKDPSPTADPDGDGAMNFAEYGLGTIPNDPSSRPVCTSDITNNRVTISFFRARTDVIYTVEGSSDLSAWIPVTVDPGLVGQTVKTSDAFDIPASGKRFLRLRMTPR
jgi:autotransporter-associated beta strand protein